MNNLDTVKKFDWICKNLQKPPSETLGILIERMYAQLKDFDDYLKGELHD